MYGMQAQAYNGGLCPQQGQGQSPPKDEKLLGFG